MKKYKFCIVFLLFVVIVSNRGMAAEAVNVFQGKWINDYGVVEISKCKNRVCQIVIQTAYAAYTCDIDAKLKTLSDKLAVFQIAGNGKTFPINLSLKKQVITVDIPEKSVSASRSMCGLRGIFHGEYTNKNTPRMYKTSFNCEHAKTKIELEICQNPKLARADIVLSRLYSQLKKMRLKNIVESQRDWMSTRDLCVDYLEMVPCISKQYNNRILSLEQDFLTLKYGKKNENKDVNFSFNYLFHLSKNPESYSLDIFQDPPLQGYLESVLPKNVYEEILSTRFYETRFEETDDSLIMITGGAPGFYTIYEGTLLITRDHQLWLAYTNFDEKSKTQLVVLYQENINKNHMPELLREWLNRLTEHMDYKDVVYKKIV